MRFGTDLLPVLLTLVLTSVLLGELAGYYKRSGQPLSLLSTSTSTASRP